MDRGQARDGQVEPARRRIAATKGRADAGHASLQTTQRYVEGSTDAKRRLVAMI